MSESNQHYQLVSIMTRYIKDKYPKYMVLSDIQKYPGDSVPNKINGFKPDFLAVSGDKKHHIIGEAKTVTDLNSSHSEKQFITFITYLENQDTSNFLLSVPYESTPRAKIILYFLSIKLCVSTTKFLIFDECDWWQLRKTSWHLI